MNITCEKKDGAAVLALEGKLDTLTAPELTAAVDDVVKETSELVLDFEKLTYISSAGLRALLAAQKAVTAQSGRMRVINSNEMVRSVFAMTKFDQILTLE